MESVLFGKSKGMLGSMCVCVCVMELNCENEHWKDKTDIFSSILPATKN